jgi:SAM-dependent methyltransferase
MTVLWDELHRQEKHRLRYPSEHVVRWLSGLTGTGERAVDIGCGYGRHVDLFHAFGYTAVGVDTSLVTVPGAVRGDMRSLPLDDETFDVALAFGVFYYGTTDDHKQAISEMHRVLKPGGQALVVTRTYGDIRSRLLDSEGRVTEGDEKGMLMNFLAGGDIAEFYKAFSRVSYELTSTTRDERRWRDADWIIQVTK